MMRYADVGPKPQPKTSLVVPAPGPSPRAQPVVVVSLLPGAPEQENTHPLVLISKTSLRRGGPSREGARAVPRPAGAGWTGLPRALPITCIGAAGAKVADRDY